MPFEGVAPAASLHIAVFDANGDEILEGKGGLELLVRVRLAGEGRSRASRSSSSTPRETLFENREHVREGIARRLRAAARSR